MPYITQGIDFGVKMGHQERPYSGGITRWRGVLLCTKTARHSAPIAQGAPCGPNATLLVGGCHKTTNLGGWWVNWAGDSCQTGLGRHRWYFRRVFGQRGTPGAWRGRIWWVRPECISWGSWGGQKWPAWVDFHRGSNHLESHNYQNRDRAPRPNRRTRQVARQPTTHSVSWGVDTPCGRPPGPTGLSCHPFGPRLQTIPKTALATKTDPETREETLLVVHGPGQAPFDTYRVGPCHQLPTHQLAITPPDHPKHHR